MLISTVTLFELYAGATNEAKERDIENILSLFDNVFLSFTPEVAKKAGELYRSAKKEQYTIEIRDLFISATAILYDLPLLTLNVKHFRRIENLKIFNINVL